METVHATAVMIEEKGVLLRGPSGSGKSDLALRLIDDGAVLIADDRTALTHRDGSVVAQCPASIAGQLEVRGIGIVDLPYIAEATLSMIVDLVSSDQVDRLPVRRMEELLGCRISSITVAPFEASAPAKIKMAIRLPAEGYPL
ncbi:MAG: serine/threonine protein kinase [Alphaproteobacteria bacterium]|jgi:HPr kinase/phosphorylase|nr:serine/threonine protein kinase [Alphaproteobacteria bacterium]